MLFAPNRAADGREGIGEGRAGFGIPGGDRRGAALSGRQSAGQQGDDGEQGQQARRGAGDRAVGPLTLRFDAEVSSHLLERGLDTPAADKPGDDLLGRAVEVGAQQSLGGGVRLLRIADHHPSDRHHGQAVVAPHGGGRGDQEVARSTAIPVLDMERLPDRPGIGRHLGQCRQALAGFARTAHGARRTGWCRLIERRIQAQACDDGEAAAPQGMQEEQRREAAVGHEDEVAARQPAAGLQGELPAEVQQRLVPASLREVVSLGGDEGGQERKRPHAFCPGNGGEQHQAHPTQSAGLDEMTVRRAHRIPIDAARRDLRSPAPLDRVVQAEDHWAARREGPDQMSE